MADQVNSLANFTNQYQVSKTLRFELKPIGETADWIKKNNIIGVEENTLVGKDAERANNYKYIKLLLDDLHRLFIEDALDLQPNSKTAQELQECILAMSKADEIKESDFPSNTLRTLLDEKADEWIQLYKQEMPQYWHEDIAELKTKLAKETQKKQIKYLNGLIKKLKKKIEAPSFKKAGVKALFDSNEEPLKLLEWKVRAQEIRPSFKELKQNDSEELVPTEILVKNIIRQFDNFSTYFSGFNENRANVYDLTGSKSTSLIHRVFAQNMQFHFNNIEKWQTIKKSIDKYADLLNTKEYNWREKLEECEQKLGFKTEEVFTVESFVNFINQSGIDRYNEITGGRPEAGDKKKIQGINEFINLTRQQAGAKRNEFPPMQLLYKQILSKSDKTFINAFEKDSEMFDEIKDFHQKCFVDHEEDALPEVPAFAKNIIDFINEIKQEKENIFIAKDKLRCFSNELTGQWNTIDHRLLSEIGDNVFHKSKYFSLAQIENALEQEIDGVNFASENLKNEYRKHTGNIFLSFLAEKLEQLCLAQEKSWRELDSSGVLNLKELAANREKSGDKGFEQIALIKTFLDDANKLLGFVKDWQVKDSLPENANKAWYELLQGFTDHFPIIELYNKTRNHVTRKPYSTEKLKINFEKPNLLGGFVESKTEKSDNGTQYGAYIFRKQENDGEYSYYLGISQDPKLFRFHTRNDVKDPSAYERMHYYQMKTASFYGNSYCGDYNSDKQELVSIIINICEDNKDRFNEYSSISITMDMTPTAALKVLAENVPSLHKLVNENDLFKKKKMAILDRIKQTLFKYSDKVPDAKALAESNSDDLADMISKIEALAQKKQFIYAPVSQKELVDSLNASEKTLYFFRISNKDLQQEKKSNHGRDNLHTMYFKGLFEEGQSTIDIGSGEIFFRKRSIAKKDVFTHKKGDILKHKGYSETWKKLGQPVYLPLTLAELEKMPCFEKQIVQKVNNNITCNNHVIGKYCTHDIIKDKRFTENKFLFHCSILLNYQASQKPFQFNDKVREFLRNNPDVNIIGIDRGEKHLLYLSVINQNGEILEQFSLNEISTGFIPYGANEERRINYHAKLAEKEKNRDQAQKSWSTIENIKELKAGYLSQVVHKLAQMIIKYNAIVVLEDLSVPFKRGRFKVEKQVYQKFEKALIDKLNYLVFKDRKNSLEPGHYLNAYQLTNQFQSFEKLGKQSGILFYTTASYTSTTDPVTGFLKNVSARYENVGKSLEFWKSFDSIIYNPAKDRFEFTYTLGKVACKSTFKEKNEDKVTRKQWTVCSCVERSRYVNPNITEDKKQKLDPETLGRLGQHELFCVTDKLKKLFDKKGIDYKTDTDIRKSLLEHVQKHDAELHRQCMYYFSAIMNMRGTDSSKTAGSDENDFIMSPVEPFFDSRNRHAVLPHNGDANGAYNIARKGICILRKIDNSEKSLTITKQDWQEYTQAPQVVENQHSKL